MTVNDNQLLDINFSKTQRALSLLLYSKVIIIGSMEGMLKAFPPLGIDS